MLKIFAVLSCAIAITACDQSGSNGQKASDILAQYAASSNSKSTPAPTVGTPPNQPQTQPSATASTTPNVPTTIQFQAPVEQSSQPNLPAPNQPKIYTFQGNVLLPPDAYIDAQYNNVDNVNVCGTMLPEPAAQAYCMKFSELQSHLYDSNHSGLDVWDIQNDRYLLLAKADKDTPARELWVEKGKFGVYHPYADIMQQKLLFLGDWSYQIQPTWPLQAYDGPGGNVIELKKEQYPEKKSQTPMVAITAVAQSSKKELWFKLNLINSLCDSSFSLSSTNGAAAAPSPVIMNIWYPAYRLEGNLRVPNVWFNAKGC